MSCIASVLGMVSVDLPGIRWQVIGVDAATTCALASAGTFAAIRKVDTNSLLVTAVGLVPALALVVIAIVAQHATFWFHVVTLGAAIAIYVASAFRTRGARVILAAGILELIVGPFIGAGIATDGQLHLILIWIHPWLFPALP